MNPLLDVSRREQTDARPGSRTAAFAVVTYVTLWVAEGAIRKWSGGAGSVFYIARDLVVVAATALLFVSNSGSRSRIRTAVLASCFVLTVWIIAVSIVGNVSLPVTAIGWRSYILPLAFVGVSTYASPHAVLTWTRRILYASAPIECALVIVQVTAPLSAFVNRQANGETSIFSVDGVIRPTGTFTAPAGLALFVLLTLAVALGQSAWGSGVRIGPVKLDDSIAILMIITTALSGSRTTYGLAALLLAFWLLGVMVSARLSSIRPIAIAALCVFFIPQLVSSQFPQVLEAFSTRLEVTQESEDTGGRVDALLVGFTAHEDFWGDGAGTHSQAGIALGSDYDWIEEESEKWAVELGALGYALALARFGFVALLILMAVKPTPHMAWRLIAVGLAVELAVGQLTQTPSTQGYLGIALSLLAAQMRLGHHDSRAAT